MAKYDLKFKLRVVKFYEQPDETYVSTISEFGISSRTLANWIKLFGKPKISTVPYKMDYTEFPKEIHAKIDSKVKHESKVDELQIVFNSRFLSWMASIFNIKNYWNLSILELKEALVEEIWNI